MVHQGNHLQGQGHMHLWNTSMRDFMMVGSIGAPPNGRTHSNTTEIQKDQIDCQHLLHTPICFLVPK